MLFRSGRFNNSKSKNYVEWQIYRAKQLPGPGDYHLPTLAEEFSRSKRGRFNMSNAKSEIEWMVYEAAGKPSPGSYDPKMDGAFKTLDELNMEEEKKRSGISPGKSKKQKSKKKGGNQRKRQMKMKLNLCNLQRTKHGNYSTKRSTRSWNPSIFEPSTELTNHVRESAP